MEYLFAWILLFALNVHGRKKCIVLLIFFSPDGMMVSRVTGIAAIVQTWMFLILLILFRLPLVLNTGMTLIQQFDRFEIRSRPIKTCQKSCPTCTG
jgi:hypothetical protein